VTTNEIESTAEAASDAERTEVAVRLATSSVPTYPKVSVVERLSARAARSATSEADAVSVSGRASATTRSVIASTAVAVSVAVRTTRDQTVGW
jgi:hypothetical protein